MKKFLLLLLICCNACNNKQASTSAEYIKNYDGILELRVSKKNITTADTIQLVVTLRGDIHQQIIPPEITDKLGDFNVLNSKLGRTELESGILKIRNSYELEPTLPGDYTIPSLTVTIRDNGKDSSISSEAIPIKVESTLSAEDTEIKDIVGLKDLPSNYVYYYLLLIPLLGVVYFLLRKRKKPVQEIKKTAEEIALLAIEKLEAEGLIDKNQGKEFYSKLSEILREFIEAEFELRAPELTTEEFLPHLKRHPLFSAEEQNLLQRFLEYCDLIKFAKLTPNIDDAVKSLDVTRNFIKESAAKNRAKLEGDNE